MQKTGKYVAISYKLVRTQAQPTPSGRIFYKGTDNNLWLWAPTGFNTGSSTQITFDGSVIGGLAVSKNGTLVLYRDASSNLKQLFWIGTWQPSIAVSANGKATDNICIDNVNFKAYFIGNDNAIYCYDINYFGAITSPSTIKKLGYETCANNAYSDLMLSEDGNFVYYRSTDHRIWYYYNDREANPQRKMWYSSRINRMYSCGAMALDIKSRGERLFYIGDTYSPSMGRLYQIEWVNADYPIVCPNQSTTSDDWEHIGVFKTDERDISNSPTTPLAHSDSTIEDIRFSIFPNPSNGIFTFSIGGLKEDTYCSLKIEDINGRIIKNMTGKLNRDNGFLTWDAAFVSEGLYFYTLYLNSGLRITGKLIKI